MDDIIAKARAWFDANEEKAVQGVCFLIGLILGAFLF